MSRFIGVFGPGRCGSSAVAGLLHHAGVSMGRNLIGPHPIFNPRGHFEDVSAHRMNRLLAYRLAYTPAMHNETLGRYPWLSDWTHADPATLRAMYATTLGDLERSPIWGMKCVMLGVVWPHLEHIFPSDRRLILVERDRGDTIRSRMRHSELAWPQAEELTDYLARQALYSVTTADCPYITVRYERLIAEPEAEAKRILEFVSEGGNGISLHTASAINHIDPELNHHASAQYCTQ